MEAAAVKDRQAWEELSFHLFLIALPNQLRQKQEETMEIEIIVLLEKRLAPLETPHFLLIMAAPTIHPNFTEVH